VIQHISNDLQSAAFLNALTESARKSGEVTDDDAEGEKLRSEIKKLNKKISNLSELLSETTAPEPLLNNHQLKLVG
jgi:hypothetical protein